MGIKTGSDVAYAFALVIGAGLATTLGAAFAFCANLASKKMLAISLGLSAGVMIYVSFGEIFMVKAVDGFRDHFCDPETVDTKPCSESVDNKALVYATLSFFGGVLVTYLLDLLVHQLMHFIPDSEHGDEKTNPVDSASNFEQVIQINNTSDADEEKVPQDKEAKELVETIKQHDPHAQHLQKVGLMSGIAIALHNFPEGLATFVAAIADPSAGLAIAIAIALHNIPEGVVVAMPVYYSSGSRRKGFFWAFMSGVSEPIGGVFGWVILSNMGDLTYAVMFAVVAGMMIYISINELLPTAFAYDPDNRYVTKSVFLGMAVMAASLLMFTI